MDDNLSNDDPAEPAMYQIVSVEADASQCKEWVVAASQKEEREHIPDGKSSRPRYEHVQDLSNWRVVVDLVRCEGDCHDEISNQE